MVNKKVIYCRYCDKLTKKQVENINKKSSGGCLMTEQNEAQFMIQAANKDKSYQERQQARKELKDLLTRFNSDDLVYMIMNLEDKKN
jgi:ribosomal protein L44E